MVKREEKPPEGSGPPEQDELPPTAEELDARVRDLEEERLRRLGLELPADDEVPPAPGPAARDWLDRTLSGE